MDSFPNLIEFLGGGSLDPSKAVSLDSLDPIDRRWKLKTHCAFFPVFPEYISKSDKRILDEDQEKEDSCIFIKHHYVPEFASKPIESEFCGSFSMDLFPPEYTFVMEESQHGRVIFNYEEEFMVQYAGRHWNNLPGLLYTMLHNYPTTSELFSELADKYKAKTEDSEAIPWYDLPKEVSETLSDKDLTVNIFQKFFKNLVRDPRRYIVRYHVFHQEDISRKGGLNHIYPPVAKILTPEILSEVNDIIYGILSETPLLDHITDDTQIPKVTPNVILPDGRPSEKSDSVVDRFARIGGGICCYKVVNDTISDESRMMPMEQPYKDSARYDPPILRGVSHRDQPYMYQLVNSDIDMDDLDSDTTNMRKIVVGDMLTRTLDWAAKNGLPLPPYGSEFYIHLGDAISEGMANANLMMAAYSRRRRHSKYIHPIPDYSYQIFSTATRFHIRASTAMTWNHIRDYILQRSPKTPVKSRKCCVFFRGNEFSHSGIRKDLYYIQDKIKPKGKFQIEIPKLSAGKELPPMAVPDMGKFQVLLDLPGWGMWSNRLKFIALTGSYVLRIIFLEHIWDNKTKSWIMADPVEDIWETFTDSFLPVEFTHTIIGQHYKHQFSRDNPMSKETFQLNQRSKSEVIRLIQESSDAASREDSYQKRVDKIKSRVAALTEDHILDYIYNMIMRQCYYYGFVK